MVVRGHDERRVNIIVRVRPEGRSKAVLCVPLPPDRLLTLADTLKPRAIITKCTLAHCVLGACT